MALADRVMLYNPRQQPVELHLDGQVAVVPPLACAEHPRSPQVDRLVAAGALQLLDPPAPVEDGAGDSADPAAPASIRKIKRPQR